MGTVSVLVPEDLEADLEQYLKEEELDQAAGVRKLLMEALERWRKERALEKLDQGEMSFVRAAEMAELSTWDFARVAKEHDVTWVGPDSLTDDVESL